MFIYIYIYIYGLYIWFIGFTGDHRVFGKQAKFAVASWTQMLPHMREALMRHVSTRIHDGIVGSTDVQLNRGLLLSFARYIDETQRIHAASILGKPLYPDLPGLVF